MRKWTLLLSINQGKFAFVLAEIRSLAEMVDIPARHFDDKSAEFARIHYRFTLVEDEDVNEEKLRRLCARSVSVYGLYEIWEEGATYEELQRRLKQSDARYRRPYFESRFAFGIEMVHRKKMLMPERIQKFDSFADSLPMKGKIDLRNPECLVVIIEQYEPPVDNKKRNYESGDSLMNVTITRFICHGQRRLIEKYAVKNRRLVGNTSMDAELSLFMTNLAQVRENSFVFDPFVGTGSMLLTSAHFGAMVLGSDISWNVMMARGKSARVGQGMRKANETLYGALEQFNLQDKMIDGLIIDNNANPWRKNSEGWFDAIITDPPYGVREKSEKVGTSKKFVDWIDFEQHYPDKIAYSLADVFADLMKFSYNHLKLNGNLVFWYPVSNNELKEYGAKLYPNHPAFELISDCEQMLNLRTSRILLTYKKVKDLGHQIEKIEGLGEVHTVHNGFREIYFQPTAPGTQESTKNKWRKPE